MCICFCFCVLKVSKTHFASRIIIYEYLTLNLLWWMQLKFFCAIVWFVFVQNCTLVRLNGTQIGFFVNKLQNGLIKIDNNFQCLKPTKSYKHSVTNKKNKNKNNDNFQPFKTTIHRRTTHTPNTIKCIKKPMNNNQKQKKKQT